MDTVAGQRILRGIELRYVLTDTLLAANEPMALRDLVSSVEAGGLSVDGRASKTVSDALRWEVGKGRVTRVRRATYAIGLVAFELGARVGRGSTTRGRGPVIVTAV